MKFEGLKQQAVCKDDGLWSIPTPRCLAPCLVPSIAHGKAEAKLGEKIGHGESLAINCTDNYEVLQNLDTYSLSSFTIVCWQKLFFRSHFLNFLFIISTSHSLLSGPTRGRACSVRERELESGENSREIVQRRRIVDEDNLQVPECFPARCKAMPTPPRNGMVVVPTTNHLSMALYQCKVL